MVTSAPALGGGLGALADRFRLPKRVPPFNTATYRIFTFIWAIALLVALLGPGLALYDRYTSAGNNSQLLLGSRAGFAVSPQDATKIRFLVGPHAGEAGIRKGDDIVAIFGIPVPAIMPVTEPVLAEKANDPAYIAMGSLLFGTDDLPVPLTVRSRDGTVREVTVTTGEDHINDAARTIGVPPVFLNFIDVIHVIFYPFLIWAAWILHRRNSRDAVSSLLSLAILLLIGAELPSSAYLSTIGVPRPVHVAMYDLGNVLLIAGILLFPHGNLSRKLAVLLVATPFLMLLHGQLYRSYFLILLALAVLSQIRSLKRAESSDLKQQIRWALFGFSGYAFFNALAYTADFFKWSAGNFGTQLTLELGAGLSFGLSMLVFQLGLLVALLRYRLYDAESIISRTATAAIVTIGIGGTFAAVMEGIITGIQFVYPESQTSQLLAAMAGAIMAAVFIEPIHRRTREWSERRFHKSLIDIREELPELMRDTRDSATVEEFLEDVLQKVVAGVLAVRGAVVIDREVAQTVGVNDSEVLRWVLENQPKADEKVIDCVPADRLFPLRMEIETSTGAFGWLLIGPRPDGSIPGRDEQKALKFIATTLGRSVRIVLSRQQEKQELMRLLEGHGDRIARIERLLKLQ